MRPGCNGERNGNIVSVRSGDVNWIGLRSGDDLWEFLILNSWRNIWPPEDGVSPSWSTSQSVP